jgi:hypothetical protein
MPAEIVPSAVAVLPDAPPQLLDFGNQVFACHPIEGGIDGTKTFRIRRARNSPSSVQVWPSGGNASPNQWNESAVISVKVHRVAVPSGRVPV